jgi:hydrogenase nickel incorporation protein HypA/HybF
MATVVFAAAVTTQGLDVHEASIAEGLLDAAIKSMPANFRRILRIKAVVGVLTNIQPESLRIYFDEIAKGTPADAAVLEVVDQPASLVCLGCGRRQDYGGRGDLTLTCACGGNNRLEGGDALYIDSMEVDT